MKCPTQPSLRVRPKVGARFMFWFMEGVGDWFLGNAPPTPPLGLESRLGLGLSFGLWEGWVIGFLEMPHPPLP